MKQLKDYLHLYLESYGLLPDGTRIFIDGVFWKDANCYVKYLVQDSNSALNGVDGSYMANNLKLILRPLSDMDEENFYSFNRDEQGGDILVTGKINDLWCAGLYDKDEYEERLKEELSTDPIELLYDLEETDHMNVLSCNRQGHIAYGVSEEWRFLVDLPTQSNWLNHLRKRGFDCDRLIDNGLAINKTTV